MRVIAKKMLYYKGRRVKIGEQLTLKSKDDFSPDVHAKVGEAITDTQFKDRINGKKIPVPGQTLPENVKDELSKEEPQEEPKQKQESSKKKSSKKKAKQVQDSTEDSTDEIPETSTEETSESPEL